MSATRGAMHCAAIVLGSAWIGAGPAHAADTLFKSVDAQGRTVYSDKRPDGAAKIDKTMTFDNLPSSELPFSYVEQLRKMRADRAKYPPSDAPVVVTAGLVLYTAAWCGHCRLAKAFLAQKGVAFRDVDIDAPAGRAAFAQLGARGVPVLQAGSRRVQGFSAQAYEAVLASLK